MKFFIFLLLSTIVFLSAKPLSSNALEGREYYLEAKCQKCHFEDEAYYARGNDANDYKRLKFWVHSCNTFFGILWFPEDENLVVEYLNEVHYKYEKTPLEEE